MVTVFRIQNAETVACRHVSTHLHGIRKGSVLTELQLNILDSYGETLKSGVVT